jgi:hypothetical protein
MWIFFLSWKNSYWVSKHREFYAGLKNPNLPELQNAPKKVLIKKHFKSKFFCCFNFNFFGSILSQRQVKIFETIVKFSIFLIPNMTYFKKEKNNLRRGHFSIFFTHKSTLAKNYRKTPKFGHLFNFDGIFLPEIIFFHTQFPVIKSPMALSTSRLNHQTWWFWAAGTTFQQKTCLTEHWERFSKFGQH